MDYFTELLTSYSLLKKRKLKLLVENDRPTAEAKANQLVKDAENKTFTQPAIGDGPRYKIGAYRKADTGEIKFGKLGSDGQISGWQKSAATDMETLIGMFSSDETKDPNHGKKPPATKGADPGQTTMKLLGAESPDLAFDISQDFMELAAIIQSPKFTENLSKEAYDKFIKAIGKGNVDELSSKRLGNYLFGATPQSLELQLASKVSKIVRAGDQFVEVPEPLDAQVKKEASRTVLELVKKISKRGDRDAKSIDVKNFLRSKFGIGQDGSVTVFTSMVSEDGVVFKDSQGILKVMLESLSEMTQDSESPEGAKPRVLKVAEERTKNVGEANNIRGTLLEDILPSISIAGMSARMPANHPNKTALEKSLKAVYAKLQDKLVRFTQFAEAWTVKFENTVMLPEEKEVYDELLKYTGPNAALPLKALFDASKSALKDRQADFFIPVGQVVGNGRKSDILECYTDLNKATRIYQSLGVQDPLNEGFFSVTNLAEMKAKKLLTPEIGAALLANGIGPDTPIYVPETSLKNYKELKEIKAGTMRSGSFNEFIRGGNENLDFLQAGLKELGLPNNESLIAYHERLEEIYKSISTLGPQRSRSATGKEVNFNSLENVAEAASELILKNKSFEELFGKESLKNIEAQIIADLKDYNESSTEWKKNKSVGEKIKHNLIAYLKNKKLEKDLTSGSPLEQESARNYVLMKLWGAGGSAAKGMMLDARGLHTGENYVLHQNQVISEIIQSMKKTDPPGPWKLHIAGNHFHFVYEDKAPDTTNQDKKVEPKDSINQAKKVRVTLSDKISARGGEDRHSTTSIVHFNNGVLRKYDRKKNKQAKLESLINTVMENQRMILLELSKGSIEFGIH